MHGGLRALPVFDMDCKAHAGYRCINDEISSRTIFSSCSLCPFRKKWPPDSICIAKLPRVTRRQSATKPGGSDASSCPPIATILHDNCILRFNNAGGQAQIRSHEPQRHGAQ